MEVSMSQNRRPYKRRTYFIKKSFQLRFILKFCLVVLMGAMISTGLLFFLSSGTLTSSFQHSRLVIKSTSQAILPVVLYTNLITLGLITLASIVVTLLVSHKLAGPIFRFEKDLQEIESGNLTKRIILRKDDQFIDLAESMNKMTDSLHSKVTDIRTRVAQLIKSAAQEEIPEEMREKLNRLQQGIKSDFQL